MWYFFGLAQDWGKSNANALELLQTCAKLSTFKLFSVDSMANRNFFQEEEWTLWGRDKIATISQTTFSNKFSWIEMYELCLKIHWS